MFFGNSLWASLLFVNDQTRAALTIIPKTDHKSNGGAFFVFFCTYQQPSGR